MKRLNVLSRFMSEVRGRVGILRTPNPVILSLSKGRTPIQMVVILALMLIAALGLTPQAHAQVMPGDILVIDRAFGTGGALFRVNPTTGNRTVVSDFGDTNQGTLGDDPLGVALDASGNILVIDRDFGPAGALFRVNPTTGNRTVLSDFGNSDQGPLGGNPFGVALDASGSILVIDSDAGTNSGGALFRVNPTNGSRTVLSDFGNIAQGALGVNPIGVAIDPSGNILVIDLDAGTDSGGALFRVNPSNGNRTVLSDFNNSAQGALGFEPFGVAIDPSGDILVIDENGGTNFLGALYRVNAAMVIVH